MKNQTINAISSSVTTAVTAAIQEFSSADTSRKKDIVKRLKLDAKELSFFDPADIDKFEKLFAKQKGRDSYELEGAALGAVIGGIVGGSIGGAPGAGIGVAVGQAVGAAVGASIDK